MTFGLQRTRVRKRITGSPPTRTSRVNVEHAQAASQFPIRIRQTENTDPLTSPIGEGEVGEPPDVPEPDGVPDAGEDELELVSPGAALARAAARTLLILLTLCLVVCTLCEKKIDGGRTEVPPP